MKATVYRQRDYAFGQSMLALRTALGLTQAGLAGVLGVSRRAVGDWEAGSSYPKAARLKQLLALAARSGALPAGREAEQAQALWHSARQKELFDLAWLDDWLGEARRDPAPDRPAGGARAARLVEWGDALSVPAFYGRTGELSLLAEWVVEENCRVVSVLGLGGIGKSALAVTLMHHVAEHFQAVVWRSLRDLPTCEILLDDLLQTLAPWTLAQGPANLERKLTILLEQLRSRRVLLVLDNLESVLEEGEGAGCIRPGFEGFGRFLRQCAGTRHQSCVLLTSREKPADLAPLEGSRAPVRALRLARLEQDACEALLLDKGIQGSQEERRRLVEAYAGNPLALKIVAQTLVDLFGGQVAPFLEQGEIIFGGIRDLLGQQFARLSPLEQRVLMWLAVLREPAGIDELQAVLVTPAPRARLLDAVEALHRRSLIERGQKAGSFTLQSLVLEHCTAQLVVEVCTEIRQGLPARLVEHSLQLAQGREYVRQTQERLILVPVWAQLHSEYGEGRSLEDTLLDLLGSMRAWPEETQGYAPANLLALLRLQRGHLRGLDLSDLALRGVSLQDVEMQDASLSGAALRDSLFTETFDAIMAVAVSASGETWAAASRNGEVRLWGAGGGRLIRSWQAHTDLVWSLAFSPDERSLASVGFDGAIKLWDLASGELLWSGQHSGDANEVSFAPDGKTLASSGGREVILWDVCQGRLLHQLAHPNLLIPVAWSPAGDRIASGDVEGVLRVWQL
ncbi:MAG: NB-ARC domain-containing protein, partial [Anaerolineaceae bacterium]|nr:NB-ARC domain-containing protein [Anaerolineaceae bacterium]